MVKWSQVDRGTKWAVKRAETVSSLTHDSDEHLGLVLSGRVGHCDGVRPFVALLRALDHKTVQSLPHLDADPSLGLRHHLQTAWDESDRKVELLWDNKVIQLSHSAGFVLLIKRKERNCVVYRGSSCVLLLMIKKDCSLSFLSKGWPYQTFAPVVFYTFISLKATRYKTLLYERKNTNTPTLCVHTNTPTINCFTSQLFDLYFDFSVRII